MQINSLLNSKLISKNNEVKFDYEKYWNAVNAICDDIKKKYDLKNEKQYNLNTCLEASLEKDILWLNIIHWFNSFKIGKVTFDEIKLIFFGCYKPLFDENGEFIDSQDYEFSITVER